MGKGFNPESMNSTKVQNPQRYGGAHSAYMVQISGVHDTHEEHELGHADGRGSVRVGE